MDDPVVDPNVRQTNVVLDSASGSCGGCAMLFFALFWNTIVFGIGYALINDDNAPFFAKMMVGLFALIGIGIAFFAVSTLLAQTRLGPPQLTISAQPLRLGEPFTGLFSQKVKSGANVNKVKVTLICRESATYRHGTNRSTATHDVLTVETILLEDVSIGAGEELTGEFAFTIPEDGMHTFDGGDNEISWLLETHTDVAGWPDYSAVYSLIVAAQRHVPGEEVN